MSIQCKLQRVITLTRRIADGAAVVDSRFLSSFPLAFVEVIPKSTQVFVNGSAVRKVCSVCVPALKHSKSEFLSVRRPDLFEALATFRFAE